MKFSYSWLSGFRGDVDNFHTIRVLDQRSENDLDLLYSQNFIVSLRQLVLLIFSKGLENIP